MWRLRENRRETPTAISVTVSRCICTLAAVLTLYIVLIDGARLGAARMQMESVSRTAQNAALAEFHRELHSRYDLFMTDTSYGGPGGGNDSFAQHLRKDIWSGTVTERPLPMFGVSIRDWTSMKIIGGPGHGRQVCLRQQRTCSQRAGVCIYGGRPGRQRDR